MVSVLDAIEMVNFVVLQMLNQTLSWDMSHLLKEYNHLPILVEDFYVYKGRQSVFFFCVCVMSLCYQDNNTDLMNELGCISFAASTFWKTF